MNIKVKIVFDNTSFGEGFEILNPPVIPSTGEMVGFDWKSYINDKELVARLVETSEDHSFIAEVLSKDYSPNEVMVLVVLHRDDSPEVERLKGVKLSFLQAH